MKHCAYFRSGLAVVLLFAVTGCHSPAPVGQTLVTVNDDAITRRDLASELEAAAVPGDANMNALAPAALDAIIDRKLVAAEAKRLGLDATPGYLAMSRRADEVILGQTLLKKWEAELPEVSSGDIQAFISDNPQMFDQRKLLQLDQITVNGKVDEAALRPLHSIDAVAQYLDAAKMPYTRKLAVTDTASLPIATFNQINAAPPGDPFAIQQPGVTQIAAVRDTRPAPPDNPDQVAADAIRHKMVADRIAQLRASAKIAWQPGAGPPGAH